MSIRLLGLLVRGVGEGDISMVENVRNLFFCLMCDVLGFYRFSMSFRIQYTLTIKYCVCGK